MSQDNQFHQYGYDHYLKAPSRAHSRPQRQGGIGEGIMRKVRGMNLATAAMAAAGVLFVAVIVAVFSSGEDYPQEIPIVKADLSPIKREPAERGGMEIPYRDSTILARVGQPGANADDEVENLLSPPLQEMVRKEDVIDRAMGDNPMEGDEIDLGAIPVDEDGRPAVVVRSAEIKNSSDPALNGVETLVDEVMNEMEAEMADAAPKPDFEIKEPSGDDILQKIGEKDIGNEELSDDFTEKVAEAAVVKKPSPRMHAAATSPETLEFVRGILEEKDSKVEEAGVEAAEAESMQAEEVANIEPAFGVDEYVPEESESVAISPGDHFVQLASITDPARAGNEWAKMQDKYSVLAGSQFRVQEANLDRGTFYRIQAGPMSKESADRICNSLKSQNKPGGCLVVK